MRISKFALGLRLQVPRNLCVRFCPLRFFGCSSGFFFCSLESRFRIGEFTGHCFRRLCAFGVRFRLFNFFQC